MREVLITQECFEFIEKQGDRTQKKFYQLIEVITEIKVVNTNFVKKIINTEFYELRIKSNNEIRVIMFSIDHSNFVESKKVVCLSGFVKKSKKDYIKAVKLSEKLLEKYI